MIGKAIEYVRGSELPPHMIKNSKLIPKVFLNIPIEYERLNQKKMVVLKM